VLEYEVFKVKVPVLTNEPITAQIGMKEGLEGGEKFEEETEAIDLAKMNKIKIRKFEGRILSQPAESRDSKEHKK